MENKTKMRIKDIFRLLLLLLITVHLAATTITGRVVMGNNTGLNGKVVFKISQPASNRTNPAIVVASPVSFSLNDGFLPPGATLVGNDSLKPDRTIYFAYYYDAYGQLVTVNPFYISGSTFDIGSAAPTSITTNNVSFLDLPLRSVTSVSANPADNGLIRGAYTDTLLCGRNSTNTGNVCLTINGSNQFSGPGISPASAPYITTSANPATSGVFRCSSSDTCLAFRNAGNTADIALTKTAFDTPLFGGKIFVEGKPPIVGPVSLTGTTTETTFLTATNMGNSGDMNTVGKWARVMSRGYYTTGATPGSLTLKIKINGTTVGTYGPVTLATSGTNLGWKFGCDIITTTTGASGAVDSQCEGLIQNVAADLIPNTSTITLDLTGTITVTVTGTLSVTTGTTAVARQLTSQLMN